ncbi:MAG: PorT family protein [Rikenellaceae bacterium]|nr:PorT family protein [Rikenellaceae bacterium]
MEKNIYKIFLTVALIFSASVIYGQHYVGVRGGYSGGGIRLEPKQETAYLVGFPTFGAGWKYYSPVKYVGAVGAELSYIKSGYKVLPFVDADTSAHRTIETIQLPLMWQPHIYMFNRKARAFLNLGVYVSYNIASDTSTVSKRNGVLYEGKYPLRTVKDNRFGYGLCAGVGIGFFIKKIEILAEARYNYGYSDLLKYANKYPGNPRRSPVDSFNLSLGVYYRLGKGGILSLPSERKNKKVKKQKIIENNTSDGNYASAKSSKTDSKGYQ